MDRRSKKNLLFVMSADGAALSSSSAATSILDASGKGLIPASFLDVGKVLRIRAAGRMSNIVTTPGTLTLDVRLTKSGPTTVVVATSPAMALNAVAKTDVSWLLELDLLCRVQGSGTTAKFLSQGKFSSESVIGSPLPSAGGSGSLLIPASAPALGTGFDSTAEQTIDLFATFSISNAGNAITCHQFSVETLG